MPTSYIYCSALTSEECQRQAAEVNAFLSQMDSFPEQHPIPAMDIGESCLLPIQHRENGRALLRHLDGGDCLIVSKHWALDNNLARAKSLMDRLYARGIETYIVSLGAAFRCTDEVMNFYRDYIDYRRMQSEQGRLKRAAENKPAGRVAPLHAYHDEEAGWVEANFWRVPALAVSMRMEGKSWDEIYTDLQGRWSACNLHKVQLKRGTRVLYETVGVYRREYEARAICDAGQAATTCPGVVNREGAPYSKQSLRAHAIRYAHDHGHPLPSFRAKAIPYIAGAAQESSAPESPPE